MPPRRSRGRHRRPKNTGGPAYLTAATLAAFTVSGFNVPGAIGDVRKAASSTLAATSVAVADKRTVARTSARTTIAASQLRESLAAQSERRASRLRDARVSMVKAAQKATEQARAAAEARRPKWVLPMTGYRLTAGFGEWGLWSSAHTGQDFAAPAGTAVRSVGDGRIVSIGYDGAYGNKVVIEHVDGTVTWYCHLLSFEVTDGFVLAGDVIGRVGSTGNSTGDHLHLEVRLEGGDPVPPLTWLRRQGVRV